jgi:DNA-binding response OmpR family regulator
MSEQHPAVQASPPHLLIVEDEGHIRELLRLHLQSEGYACSAVGTSRAALQLLRSRSFDVVVLDLMLPDTDGLALCETVRSEHTNRGVPILMLTARADETDKLAGFNSGADDYLTKPFSMRELSARVAALRRRGRGAPVDPLAQATTITAGDLTLVPGRRELQVRNRTVPLTRHEFRLLYELASHPGEVYTRDRLLAELWHGETYVTGRSIDTLVRRLRCKIEPSPSHPQYLVTIWGEGYKFADVPLSRA